MTTAYFPRNCLECPMLPSWRTFLRRQWPGRTSCPILSTRFRFQSWKSSPLELQLHEDCTGGKEVKQPTRQNTEGVPVRNENPHVKKGRRKNKTSKKLAHTHTHTHTGFGTLRVGRPGARFVPQCEASNVQGPRVEELVHPQPDRVGNTRGQK